MKFNQLRRTIKRKLPYLKRVSVINKSSIVINVFYKKQPTYNPQKRPKTIDYDGSRVSEADKKIKVNTDDSIYGTCYHQRYYVDDGLRYPINFITVNSQKNECNNSKRLHSSQKPVELLEYFIRTYRLHNG